MELSGANIDLVSLVLEFGDLFPRWLATCSQRDGKKKCAVDYGFVHAALYPAGTCTLALGSMSQGPPQSEMG